MQSPFLPGMPRRFVLEPTRVGDPLGAAGWIAMPDLPTGGDIAAWLGLSVEELAWFTDLQGRNAGAGAEALRHYHCRWIPKRDGRPRLIETPKPRLMRMQRLLLQDVLAYVPPHPAAHAFRARHSALSHAAVHMRRPVVLRFDLQDFFASVQPGRIIALFRALGFPTPAARLLAGLCLHRTPSCALRGIDVPWATRQRLKAPHLPQGAPTSPALANLAAFGLDTRLEGLAQALEARYTRYADDLTFSGGPHLQRNAARIELQVARIAREEAFLLNHRKTRVMPASQRQRVTGVVVNEGLHMARADYDRFKAVLHQCVRDGPAAHSQGRQDFRAHLNGRLAHLRSLQPHRADKLQALFERIVWA